VTSSSSSSSSDESSSSSSNSSPSSPPGIHAHYHRWCFHQDSLMNPLAPRDHIPLKITWGTSRLLELVAALLDPVPQCHLTSSSSQRTSSPEQCTNKSQYFQQPWWNLQFWTFLLAQSILIC
jgi:hypothetical protein